MLPLLCLERDEELQLPLGPGGGICRHVLQEIVVVRPGFMSCGSGTELWPVPPHIPGEKGTGRMGIVPPPALCLLVVDPQGAVLVQAGTPAPRWCARLEPRLLF